MSLTIGLDIFPLERGKWSGIEIYTFELLKGLLAKQTHLHTFSLTHIDDPLVAMTEYKFWKSTKASSAQKILYNYYYLSRLVGSGIDVYHSPNFTLPYGLKAKKKIITIHDLAFLRFPEFYDLKTRLYFRGILSRSIRNADTVICISKSCHDDFLYYYPKFYRKAEVIYNGFNNFSDVHRDPELIKGFNLKSKYLLSVGATHPRKNLERMLLAFGKLVKESPDLMLVLAGSISQASLSAIIDRNNLQSLTDRVKVTGYISQDVLVQLYKHASLLFFPSVYEGFGFPILEAMSCGLPVLTSSTSSCPELCGYESMYLADPLDTDDIAEKASQLLKDQTRSSLVELGYQKASEFSWSRMCEKTFELYGS